MSLQLLGQSLRAMAAVLPFRTVLWVATPELWIINAAGALLPICGRLTNRHLYQLFDSSDETVPAIAAHHQALEGVSSEYDQEFRGHTWKAAVVPTIIGGKVIGIIGTATLITVQVGAHVPREPEPEISLVVAPDAEHDLRPGDYLWEPPTRHRPALLQRALTAHTVARLRAEGKLFRLSPPRAASPHPAAPKIPACVRRRAGDIALVRSG